LEPLGHFCWKPGISGNLDKAEIRTPRLQLIPVRDKDAEDIFREFTTPISQYMIPAPAESIAGIYAFIEQTTGRRGEGGELIVAARRVEDRNFVGVIGLHALLVPRRAEIGLWLAAYAHRQGYGFEGCDALLRWATQNIELDVVEYPVDKSNLPSRKLAEKLGGRVAGERRQMAESGRLLDEVVYEIDMRSR
jgi:RimJ/RimL family protein N-acetyltransferase